MSTIDLYTAGDKKRVRDTLTKEQNNLCIITGLPIGNGQHVLEHAHDDEMFVRGVASRQANSACGVYEGTWNRYLKWWYNGTLSDFLRQCADFLDRPPDKRYRHDGWIKRVKVDFNKLKSAQQDAVLIALGTTAGTNLASRKALFAKVILDRTLGYDTIKNVINLQRNS